MTIDLDKLEAIALAAKPGKRVWNERYGTSLDIDGEHVLFAEPIGYDNSSVLVDDAEAAFIAALDRETVLALIAMARGRGER